MTDAPLTVGQIVAAGILFAGSAGVIGLGHLKNQLGTRALEEEVMQEEARQRGWKLTVLPNDVHRLEWYENETQPLPSSMDFENRPTYVGFDKLVNFYQRVNSEILDQRERKSFSPSEVRQVAHFGADDHKNYQEDLGLVTYKEILNALKRCEDDPTSLKIRLEKNPPKYTQNVDQDGLLERREAENRFLQNRLLDNYRAREARARQHRVQYRGG